MNIFLFGSPLLVTTIAIPAIAQTSNPTDSQSPDSTAPTELETENAETSANSDCPRGFLCVWSDPNFRGQKKQFNLPGPFDLTEYGFNDKMSSWHNNSNVDAHWFYNTGGHSNPFLQKSRCMQANSKNSFVGREDNDQASAIEIYTDINLTKDLNKPVLTKGQIFYPSYYFATSLEYENFSNTYNQTISEFINNEGIPDLSPLKRIPERAIALEILSKTGQNISTFTHTSIAEKKFNKARVK